MDVVEVEVWCRSALVTGSAGLRGADTTTLLRTSVACVVVLVVQGQQLSQTLLSRHHWSLQQGMVWVLHQWQVHLGQAPSLLPLVASAPEVLVANNMAGHQVSTPYLLDLELQLVPTLR